MSEVDWTNDAVIELVEAYSKFPELWDSKHALYRTPVAKYEAWTSLSQQFECDISDVRKKLNSIFASHRREKAKVRAGAHSTWFLYPYMKFWPTHIENNHYLDQQQAPNPEYEEPAQEQMSQNTSDDSSDSEQPVQVKEEPVEKPKKKFFNNRSVQKARLRPKKIARDIALKRDIVQRREVVQRSQLDGKLIETLKLLKKSEQTKKKDECDSFGEYIATSLRKHDERTQSMIKQAINNILFEQEMKKYSSGQYTVLLTGVEENPLILGDQDSDH